MCWCFIEKLKRRPRKCYIGDINSSDFDSPESAKKHFNMAKEHIKLQYKKIRIFRQKIRRLEKRVISLQNQLKDKKS